MAAGAYADESIYQIGDRWTDQDGNAWELGEFKGETVVLAMFFTSCQYVCPRIVADMQQIESLLDDEARPDVRFILVSFDSQRDLPPVLKRYQKDRKLAPDRWTLLHGDENAVQNLAAALGVKYKRDVSGDYGHSTVISVLDRAGEIVHQQEGLGADPSDTVQALKKTLSD
ncbi:MAG TPA: SCO family protein [Kiritimatiellia bacterium]